MIIFEKIRYVNLMSVGAQPVEIDLNSHRASLIVGKNGSGKCLRKTTEIEIQFSDKETERKFQEYLKKQNVLL
jgi:hypothetical protein